MTVALSAQLESLRRERDRLEQLLMLDANWRALRQLETPQTAGRPIDAAEAAARKAELVGALGCNRIFAARANIVETIERLCAEGGTTVPTAEPGSLSSRIVMLAEPGAEMFRARIRMKAPVTAGADTEAAPLEAVGPPPAAATDAAAWADARPTAPERHRGATPAPPVTDALELIDGLGRPAVEQLLDAGVTQFAQIARWTSADVAHWRAHLDGLAAGSTGGWIEQAALLATGSLTHFAQRARRGEFAALVPEPPPEPPPATMRRPMIADDPVAVGEQAGNGATATGIEVIVVAREPGPAAAGHAAGIGRSPPPKLLQRLKELRKPDRFEADGYAAYRGNVEEASVTIVRQEAATPRAPSPAEPRAERGLASRFLRALTGKG